jgi:hypothetical protein
MKHLLMVWSIVLLSILDGSNVHAAVLIIDTIIMHSIPQLGTTLFCFIIKKGDNEKTFNIPYKEFGGDSIIIDMNLQLTNVNIGDEVQWEMGLDDDQTDVCGSRAEDYAEGSFIITQKGSKKENPKNNWSFIINYHLQPVLDEQGKNIKHNNSKKERS